PGCAHGAAEGAADVVGQCVLVSPGIRGDGEVPPVAHGGVDAAAVVGPSPLRAHRTRQDGGAVVLGVAVRGAWGGLPPRDEHRVVVVAPLLGLHEFHGVVGGGAGVPPVRVGVGVAQAVSPRGRGDGLRVLAVELGGDRVAGGADHLGGAGLIGGRAVLEHVVRDVELDDGQPGACLVLIAGARDETGGGVGEADLGARRRDNETLVVLHRPRRGGGGSGGQRRGGGYRQGECADGGEAAARNRHLRRR